MTIKGHSAKDEVNQCDVINVIKYNFDEVQLYLVPNCPSLWPPLSLFYLLFYLTLLIIF